MTFPELLLGQQTLKLPPKWNMTLTEPIIGLTKPDMVIGSRGGSMTHGGPI